MSSGFLIFIIILLYSFQTLFCTIFSKNYGGKQENVSSVFCCYEAFGIVIISLFICSFKMHVSIPTLICGIINALLLFGYNTGIIEAGKRGSYAFFNMVQLFGCIIIPMLYGIIFLDEKLNLLKYIAIFIMFLSLFLMCYEKNKNGEKAKKGYYFFCILLFLTNGFFGTFLKVQAKACPNENQEMAIITYGIMGVVALINLMIKEKGKFVFAFAQNKKSIIPLIISLLSAGFAVNFLMYVIGNINTGLFYTVECGGVLLLSCIYSIMIFKEKPGIKKIIGMALAIASITILSM